MPRRVSLLNYAYAIGRIRALEKYLLKEEVLHRAIESDLNEALRLFAESDIYGDGLLHIKNSQQLEGVLNHELSQLKELIRNLILDKELVGVAEINSLERVKDVLGSYPSELLRDYLMHLIDMHNIKTFLRLYILKEPEERLNNLLVCEGFIKKDVLLKLYTQPLAALLNKLEYVHKRSQVIDYAYFLKEAIENVEKDRSFLAFEKSASGFLIQILKPAKYLSFGPEPVLAYYFARVNEINLIRLIILAKLNNVSGELVKERLNGVYA